MLRNILPSFEETPLPSLDMSRSLDNIFDMAGSSRRNFRLAGVRPQRRLACRHSLCFHVAAYRIWTTSDPAMAMASAGPENSDSAACFNATKDRSRHRVAGRWRLRSVTWHTRSLRANALALSDTGRNGTVVATNPCRRSAFIPYRSGGYPGHDTGLEHCYEEQER